MDLKLVSQWSFLAFMFSFFDHTKAGMDDEMAELIKMIHDNCAEETGADMDLVAKVNAGTQLMPDPKLKCYIKCTMETAGMMSEGTVDVEAILSMLPEEMSSKFADSFRACGTQKGGDDCETAYLTQVCWQNSEKDHYFLI